MDEKKIFVNPYNFIPFEGNINDKRISRETAYAKKSELLSGWLDVELTTRTPLIIPDGAHPRYWDTKKNKYVEDKNIEEREDSFHKEYDFFRSPDGIPTIPGSELRGMLRSVYEIVTNSCVPFLLDEKPISRRVPVYGALCHHGLLAYENDHWVLYKATIVKKEAANGIYVNEKDGCVYVDGKKLPYKNGEYVEDLGWVQYNIPVNKSEYSIRFLKKGNDIVKRWEIRDNEPYRTLLSALNRDGAGSGRNSNKIQNKNLSDALEKAKSGDKNLVPVYYMSVTRIKENGDDEVLVYLSNSSIGRIAQKRKWNDIMGDYVPCSSTDELCPACLLFGTTNGKGLKGRVQVTDATPDNVEKLTYEKHTLDILSTPRTSAFEFYLRKPTDNATFWNFDFYGEMKKYTLANGKEINRIEYYDLPEATPRGRKMYWHSKPAKDSTPNNMNNTVEAVNGCFNFKIYFEEITQQQLNTLIWIISLGENKKDGTKLHKLGHARPLGYGSVKLQVVSQNVRKPMFNKENGNIEVELEHKSHDELNIPSRLNAGSKAEKCLLNLADFNYIPEDIPVMYPREKRKDEDNIYTWFANNRKNPKYVKTLPEPDDKYVTLLGNWNERLEGKVKYYDSNKNFGIIIGQNKQEYSIKCDEKFNPNLKAQQLRKNAKVSFEPYELKNGKLVANKCRAEEN